MTFIKRIIFDVNDACRCLVGLGDQKFFIFDFFKNNEKNRIWNIDDNSLGANKFEKIWDLQIDSLGNAHVP